MIFIFFLHHILLHDVMIIYTVQYISLRETYLQGIELVDYDTKCHIIIWINDMHTT